MLWHSTFMLLNMNIDALECAAGRDGTEVARIHREGARVWARSPQSRRCVVHAVMVQRQFKHIPIGMGVPIHAPSCLYQCGIVWYCYLRFGGDKYPQPDEPEIDMPELSSLGLNGMNILQDEIHSQGGNAKSLQKFLLGTIHLLRRVNYWGVAESLATTLLALVDDGIGLF